MRNRSGVILLFVFVLLCTLSACKETADSGSYSSTVSDLTMADEALGAALLAEHPLRLCDGQASGGYYLAEDQGAYGNISYIDYETHRQIYLCARPECTHDTSDCASVIAGSVLLFTANDHLYIIRTRSDEYGPPELICAMPDGSDRRQLTQFPAHYQFDYRFYTDDTFLYLIADVVDNQSAQTQRQLLRVNLADGGYEVGYTLPPEFAMCFVESTIGRCLIFTVLEMEDDGDWTSTCYFLDVDTMTLLEDKAIRMGRENGSIWHNGKLYETLEDEDAVRITDPVSGSVSTHSYARLFTLPGYPAFRHDVGMSCVSENILGLMPRPEDDSDGQSYVFHMNLDDGEIVPFTLFKTFKPEPIGILARQDDQFLVIVDWKMLPGDGVAYIYVPKYALIQENDYLMSIPNYTPILSDFYPDAWT